MTKTEKFQHYAKSYSHNPQVFPQAAAQYFSSNLEELCLIWKNSNFFYHISEVSKSRKRNYFHINAMLLDKKEKCRKSLYFLHFNVIRFLQGWIWWHRRSIPYRQYSLPDTHNRPGHRSSRRYRRTEKGAA